MKALGKSWYQSVEFPILSSDLQAVMSFRSNQMCYFFNLHTRAFAARPEGFVRILAYLAGPEAE